MALARTAAPLLAVIVLAGCGSGKPAPTTSTSPTTTPATATRTTGTLLQQAQHALGAVSSVHVAGTQELADGTTALSGDVDATGDLTMNLTQKGVATHLVIVGKAFYLRAPASFWRTNGTKSPLAARLADRWVKAPSSGGITRLSEQLRPSALAHCLGKVGTVRPAGSSTVDGQPVSVLRTLGDKPGTAPGQLFVAARGAPLPLRITQTGPNRPGKTGDPLCDSPDDSNDTRRSDIRLSRFGAAVHIAAPAGALDLEALVRSLSGSTES